MARIEKDFKPLCKDPEILSNHFIEDKKLYFDSVYYFKTYVGYGLCDSNNHAITSDFYHSITRLRNGNFIFEKDHRWALADKHAKLLSDFVYDDITYLDDHHYALYSHGKWAMADQQLNLLTEYKYDNIDKPGNAPDSVFAYYVSGHLGLMNAQARTLTPPDYLQIYCPWAGLPYYIALKTINNYDTLINQKADGLASGYDRFGMLDNSFKEVLPFEFVYLIDTIRLADASGNDQEMIEYVTPPLIDQDIPGEQKTILTALVPDSAGNIFYKEGLFTLTGRTIIPPRWAHITLLERPGIKQTMYSVSEDDEGKFALFDSNGKQLTGFIYDEIREEKDKLYFNRFETGLLDTDGRETNDFTHDTLSLAPDTLITGHTNLKNIPAPPGYIDFYAPFDTIPFFFASKKVDLYDTLVNEAQYIYDDNGQITDSTYKYPDRKRNEKFFGLASSEICYGGLDKNFKEITPFRFKTLFDSTTVYDEDGYEKAEVSKPELIDKSIPGEQKIILNYISYENGNASIKQCVYTLTGRMVIPPMPSVTHYGKPYFKQTLFAVQDEHSGKFALYDHSGKPLTGFIYTSIDNTDGKMYYRKYINGTFDQNGREIVK